MVRDEEIDLRQAFVFGAPEPCVAVEYQEGESHLRPLIESELRRVHRSLHTSLRLPSRSSRAKAYRVCRRLRWIIR
jgi:hypothetical protein